MLDFLEMFRDHGRSPEIQKMSVEQFHKEKVQSKMKKSQSLASVPTLPSLQTKSGRGLFPIVAVVVVVFRKGGGERSIFINSDLLVYLQIVFSVCE